MLMTSSGRTRSLYVFDSRCARVLGCAAAVFLASLVASPSARAFSLLGTDGNLNLSASLQKQEMFRYNSLPTVAGIKTIFYRLDPNFTAAQAAAINAAFTTWNGKLMAQPNTTAGPWGNGDLESIALHEIGHALGLGHNGGYAVEGPSIHWDTDNNPFNAMVNPDFNNLAARAARPNNATYTALGNAGLSSSVMTYDPLLAPPMAHRRRLEFDDLGGLAYGEAGRDNLNGTADDFTYRLLPDPVNPNGVDRDVLRTPGGRLLNGADESTFANQLRGGTIDVFAFNPYMFNPNNPQAGNGIADMVYDRRNVRGNGAFTLMGGDIYLNIPGGGVRPTTYQGRFTHTVPVCAGANVCNGLGTASFNTGVNARTPFNVGFDFVPAQYAMEPQGVFSVGVLSVRNGETFLGTTPSIGNSNTFLLNLRVTEMTNGIPGAEGDILLAYWSSPNAWPGLRNPRNGDIVYNPLRPQAGGVRILEGSTLAETIANISLLMRRGSLEFEGFYTDFEFTDVVTDNTIFVDLPEGMMDPDTGYFFITVPEPAAMALMLFAALASLAGRRR
jgi:hypothetical protein